jgi:ABC-type uncharacterized transport system substrate-binding protein
MDMRPAWLALAIGVIPGQVLAHPHVWVTTKSEMIYDPAGELSAVRHAWTFDDMFSSYAIQGLDTDGDGKLSREELQPLAEINVTTMAESDYFTFAKSDAADLSFADATDYWLEWNGTQLTLHFTLPLSKPLAKSQPVSLEIYDPTYFVDFRLAEQAAASLVAAPPGCMASVQRHEDQSATPGKTPSEMKLSEDYFSSLAGQNVGEQFANRITVRCAS